MYAVIMQSKSNYTVGARQTVIIPMLDKSVRVLTRIGSGRGVSGSWKEEAPTFQPDEVLIGEPSAVSISATDYKVLTLPITPSNLLNKILRTLVEYDTLLNAEPVYDTLYDFASNDPVKLVTYTKDYQSIVQHTVTPAVAEVTASIEQTIEQVIDDLDVPMTDELVSAVAEAVAEVTPIHTHQTESDSPMHNAFQSTIHNNGRDAVLVVPDVKPYFARTIDGVSETRVYDYARSTQQNVLLTGHAGTGKTSSAMNYAALNHLPFVMLECTMQIDQSITQGRFVATGQGNAVEWKYSQLATIVRGPGVVLINELTRMTPKSASLFLRLLQERELVIEPLNEIIKVHPDCLIVADQNTGMGYTGTSTQDNALLDRFSLKLEFQYDTEIEAQFIKSPALLDFAQAIRIASETNDEFSVPMSTRALINFQANAQHLGFKFAVSALLNNYPKTDGEREAIKLRFDADATTIADELGVDASEYLS